MSEQKNINYSSIYPRSMSRSLTIDLLPPVLPTREDLHPGAVVFPPIAETLRIRITNRVAVSNTQNESLQD